MKPPVIAQEDDGSNCQGQGYNGASNMRSERVSVQALIRQDAPKASPKDQGKPKKRAGIKPPQIIPISYLLFDSYLSREQ